MASLTNDQLEARIIDIEKHLTDILTVLKGVASRIELSRLNATKQLTLDDHESRISTLETQMTNLNLGNR